MSDIYKQRLPEIDDRILMRFSLLLLLLALISACSQPVLDKTAQQQLKAFDKQLGSLHSYYRSNSRPDFNAFNDVTEKKRAFFAYLTPAIQAQNLIVERDKLRLQAIENQLNQQNTLSGELQQWFELLTRHYRIDADSDLAISIKQLKQRIAPLPAELVLAQAANESAWGTSRFATQGNNYFGQWCYAKGCGMVPTGRIEGASHEVARFDSAYDSVAAYFRNLNSNKAYKQLRQIRTASLEAGQTPVAEQLVNGLEFYSERGADYIADITRLIEFNRALMPTARSTEDI